MTTPETAFDATRQEYYDRREPLREAHKQHSNSLTGDEGWLAELARWVSEEEQLRAEIFGMPVLTIDEAEEIRGDRAIFNGCNGAYLRERYGDRVLHVMGVGWFLAPEGSR